MTYGELITTLKKVSNIKVVYDLLGDESKYRKFVELIEIHDHMFNVTGEREIDGVLYPNTIRLGGLGAKGGVGFDEVRVFDDKILFNYKDKLAFRIILNEKSN